MGNFRKHHIKLLTALAVGVWIILWSQVFLKLFINYLNLNPTFAGDWTIPVSWAIKWFGYAISFFVLGTVLTGKYVFRFSLMALFLSSFIILATPPVCIAPDGSFLVTASNQSCLMAEDAFFSWLLTPLVPIINVILFPFISLLGLFSIKVGYPSLYTLVYSVGPTILLLLFILTISKKEMWHTILNKFNGIRK